MHKVTIKNDGYHLYVNAKQLILIAIGEDGNDSIRIDCSDELLENAIEYLTKTLNSRKEEAKTNFDIDELLKV